MNITANYLFPSVLLVAATAGQVLSLAAPSAHDLSVRVQTSTGQHAVVLLSTRPTAPVAVPGVRGSLALDAASLLIVPLEMRRKSDHTDGEVVLPSNVRRTLPWAQVLHFGAEGAGLSQSFSIGDVGEAVPQLHGSAAASPTDAAGGRVVFRRSQDGDVVSLDSRPVATRPQQRLIAGKRAGRISAATPELALPSSSEMSGLEPVRAGDAATWPYSPNCRIEAKWILSGEEVWSQQGSGVLVDPAHVMTAAHVLWNVALGMADSVTVVPAFDESPSVVDDRRPFGHATWRAAMAHVIGSGYIHHLDWDDDYAVLRLDRPIGALTGWFGYGYDSDCSRFRDSTFWARSYPAGGGYDGGDMFSRSGSFDSCPNRHQARFDRMGYEGESGSGYYVVHEGSRYVLGIQSHFTTTLGEGLVTDSVRLDAARCDAIGDLLDEARGAGSDLIPLGVETSTNSVLRGGTLRVSFVLLNYGRAGHSGLAYDVRLSTDRTITTDDRSLGLIMAPTYTLSSLETDVLSWEVTIPASIGTANYYVGITLAVDDADASNNATSNQDVVRVYVGG